MNEDQYSEAGQKAALIGGAIGALIALFVLLIVVISAWKIFTKAGQPGWAAIVPFYNVIVLLQIVGKPLWWIVLLIIPGVNFVVAIIVMLALAERFGKGAGFGIGLAFLGIIFFPILAFGDARYQGPALPAA